MWWRGPSWLAQSPNAWPPDLVPDSKPECYVNVSTEQPQPPQANPVFESLAKRYSSWPKLVRITAYLLRFGFNSRKPHGERVTGACIRAEEFGRAESCWFRYLQHLWFDDEITSLTRGQSLAPKHVITSLDPFVDSEGCLRVGGRLANADLAFSAKHPVILKDHPVVRLFVEHVQKRCLHGGLQLTLSTLRQTAWVIRARAVVRAIIDKCMACARLRSESISQFMGALPPMRVLRSERAFLHCGIDYAGPFQIREASGRGKRTHSAYIALFVCMAVRAIHLELVMDYSANAFLAAFKRFTARRGTPSCMYSDRGTTFQRAYSELQRMFQAAAQSPQFRGMLAMNGIRWEFIPPAAPHFGGLWEAGVRSVKHHLRRVVGSHTPTIEEFVTLLCQIEACLNSRPIAPITDHPDDLAALTPGHFLVGGEIRAIPEPFLLQLNSNRLSRWQTYQQLLEGFWKRWSADYVTSLQQRSKWRVREEPVRVGQMVLVRDANLPPTKWRLGRVIKCHPGADDLTRVVSVRTATTILVRPLAKLARLPIIHDDK